MYRLELWFRKKDETIAKELLGPQPRPRHRVCGVTHRASWLLALPLHSPPPGPYPLPMRAQNE